MTSPSQRFQVKWPARAMAPDRKLHHVAVVTVMPNALVLQYPYGVTPGTQVNVEFILDDKGKQKRISAQTQVLECNTTDTGTELELRITRASAGDIHTYNNVLMRMANAVSE